MRAIGIVAMATGCVVVREPETGATGQVEISWQVGPSGCTAAGVTEVSMDIGGVGGTYDCDAGGAIVSVPEGVYRLVLDGFDAQGRARYGGVAERVVVGASQTTAVPTVVLGALPADITAQWFFQNGRLCSANNVEDVDVTLFDDDYIVDSVQTTCDGGEATLKKVPAGAYVLSLLARNSAGQVTFTGESDVSVGKGDHVVMEVVLIED